MRYAFPILTILILFQPCFSRGSVPYPAEAFTTGPNLASQSRIGRVQNIPPVIDVADFPFCSIAASYYVLQHYYCEIKNLDCGNLSRQDQIQFLDLAGRNRIKLPDDKPEDIEKYKLNRVKRIEMFNGGDALRVLESVVKGSLSVRPEICMPLDQFLTKMGGRRNEAKKIEAKYYQSLPAFSQTEGSAICVDCLLQELNFGRRSMTDPDQKKAQLDMIQTSENFETYLYRNSVASCEIDSLAIFPKPAYKFFPAAGGSATNQEISTKIQEVLAKGRPVTLSNICTESKWTSKAECTIFHSTTIVDYDLGCNQKGCFPRVKILEPYGEKGQKRLDGGWVGLDNLLNHLDQPVNYTALAWLELPEGFQKK